MSQTYLSGNLAKKTLRSTECAVWEKRDGFSLAFIDNSAAIQIWDWKEQGRGRGWTYRSNLCDGPPQGQSIGFTAIAALKSNLICGLRNGKIQVWKRLRREPSLSSPGSAAPPASSGPPSGDRPPSASAAPPASSGKWPPSDS